MGPKELNIWMHSDANGTLHLDASLVQGLLGCTVYVSGHISECMVIAYTV